MDIYGKYIQPVMIQLQDLLDFTGGELHSSTVSSSFTDFCYDSRLATADQLFLAIKTDRRDGHAFIVDAVRAGCTGVLCQQPPKEPIDATVVVVPDVRMALQQWARAILKRYQPTVIGVTGSVGKTSTKRAIATVLAGLAPTFASQRSFNSLFGLPIALGRLEPHHRFAVLEMGVDRFGEMRRLVELFPPHIAVVTNVAPTHLRFLRDEEHIAQEKAELVRALPPNGYAVLNAEDSRVAAMAELTQAQVQWFSSEVQNCGAKAADARCLRVSSTRLSLNGTSFDVIYNDERYQAFIPLVGPPSVAIALAAIGVALCCGVPISQAIERLKFVQRQAGRLNPLAGLHGSTILDDTYNASPASLHAALDTLANLPAKRRIAVLGDMLELGAAAAQLHQKVGQHALMIADLVVTKGDLAAHMIPADARQSATTVMTHTPSDALAAVRSYIQPGDLVLLKGSAEARMEQIVAGLLAPEVIAADVLVRQERAFTTVRVTTMDRPTWLEVDLQAIATNAQAIKTLVGPRVRVMATLKADAYGHGAVRVARTVLQHGVDSFAVATLGEAAALQGAGIDAPILILGYTPPWQVRDAIRRNLRITVFDADVARELGAAAQELQQDAIVHVKVDTGMARLGLQPDEVLPFLQLLHALPGVTIEGLFTHFATADSADQRFAHEQLRRFTRVVDEATQLGLRPPLVHAANSAAILRLPEAHFDLVRPGLALYGLAPSSETPLPAAFRPALSFKTEIAQVKQLPSGTPISYGGTFVTQRPSVIATIPVGYADGFRRSPSWHEVLVHGQRASVVGRVAMDYAMLDVTDVPDVRAGDEVVLIGSQSGQHITADEVAAWLGTINYEVVAAILPRVPRVV